MIGIALLILTFGGAIGCLVMADPQTKPLGVIPMIVWLIGFFSPTFVGSQGISWLVALALEGSAAAYAMFLYNKARLQKMTRAADL